MENSSDCPGRFKCHGPSGWCDACGDVDLVCDDPKCDAHSRGEERRKRMETARAAMETAEREFDRCKKQYYETAADYRRWKEGNPVMVARANRQ